MKPKSIVHHGSRGTSGGKSHGQHKGAFVVTAASTAARDISFKGARNVKHMETSHQALNKTWPRGRGERH